MNNLLTGHRLLFLLPVLVGLISYGLGRSGGTSSVGAYPLVVPPADLQFGESAVSTEFGWDLSITNASSQDITVDEFIPSCHCVSYEPKTMELRAGATKELHLVLDLTPGSEDDARSPRRRFETSIKPRLRGYVGPDVVWAVSGDVVSVIDCEPMLLDFGEELVEGELFPVREVHGECDERLESITASCDPRLASVTVKHNSDRPHIFQAIVAPNPELKEGRYDCFVRLCPEGVHGALPADGFRVTLRVHGRVEAKPSRIEIGELRHVANASTDVLLVGNVADATGFSVETIDVPLDGSLAVSSRSTSSRNAFQVQIARPLVGYHKEVVRFRIVDDGGRRSEVRLPVSYYYSPEVQ